MYDLWYEFVKLEIKVEEFGNWCWIFEWDEYNVFEEVSLICGGFLVNFRWMFFLDRGFMKLEKVNFSLFFNVIVLKFSWDEVML